MTEYVIAALHPKTEVQHLQVEAYKYAALQLVTMTKIGMLYPSSPGSEPISNNELLTFLLSSSLSHEHFIQLLAWSRGNWYYATFITGCRPRKDWHRVVSGLKDVRPSWPRQDTDFPVVFLSPEKSGFRALGKLCFGSSFLPGERFRVFIRVFDLYHLIEALINSIKFEGGDYGCLYISICTASATTTATHGHY